MQFRGFLQCVAGSKVKAGVVTTLASSPSKRWTGSQMARETGFSQPQVWKALHELEKQAIVAHERSGKAEVWRFNSRHVFAGELSRLSRPRNALAEAVAGLMGKRVGLGRLELVVLFGSVARQDESHDSDIDLLIAYRTGGDESAVKRGTSQAANELLEMTGNALAPVYYSAKELKAKRKGAFVMDALTQGTVIYQRGVTGK